MMRMLTLLCLVALLTVPCIPQNDGARISGTVLKADGQRLEDALVVIRDYGQTRQPNVSDIWESRTATDGSFSFALPRGCYDMLVSADAQSLPFARRLCVQSGQPPLKIKLKADPHPRVLLHLTGLDE